MGQPAYKIKDIEFFIEQFYWDPVGFVRVIIEADPTREQMEILQALVQNRHVSVRSGHGIGKSSSLAWLILWFLCTRDKPKVPCTAPTGQQLYDILWAEVAKWHRQMNPIFRFKLEVTTSRVYWKSHPKEAFAVAKVSRKESPESLSGMHGDHLLFIVEEASGVPDEVFQPVEGSLTGQSNFCIMAGNPIRNSGYFYDSHHKDRTIWETLHYNSEDAERVDKVYPVRMAQKYGRDSNIYKVRVKGDFATQEADQLIDLEWLELAVLRRTTLAPPIMWGLDVARYGDDTSVLAKRHGNKIQSISRKSKKDTMYIAGWVKNEYESTPQDEKPERVNVDIIGVGSGVADRLREQGLPIVDVNVSERAHKSDKFASKRDELWWNYREFVRLRGEIPDDQDLVAQSSGIKYKFDSSGRIKVEGKEEMKKRLGRSPDDADAVCLALAIEGDLSYFL